MQVVEVRVLSRAPSILSADVPTVRSNPEDTSQNPATTRVFCVRTYRLRYPARCEGAKEIATERTEGIWLQRCIFTIYARDQCVRTANPRVRSRVGPHARLSRDIELRG